MLGEAEAKAYEPVGQLKPRSPKLTFELKGLNWLERLTEWRCEEISITRLPAWLALLALVGWLSMLIAHFTFKGTHIGRFATVCKQQLCTGSVFKKIRVTSETMSRYSGSDVDLNRSDLSSTSRRTPSELRSGLESYRTTSSLETRDSQCERNDSFEVVHEGGWTHNTLKLREATRSLDRASVGFRHVWTRALTSRLARHLSSVSNERWSMDRIVLALPA